MDLNKIAAVALESLGDSVRDDLRGRLEEIKKKRDVLERALGRAREQVLKALPRDLRAKFAKEDVAFLFFMKIDEEAPDFAHFITDEVREAVEKLIDCERIIETFDDEEPAPIARPAALPPAAAKPPRLRPEARPEPNQPPPRGKIPVSTTAKGVDRNRDALIEKAILEAIHLQGEFRNTNKFSVKQDITRGECLAVLKRLRERGVISSQGKGCNTSYIFTDPALRPKNKSAAPAESPPAPPAVVDPPPRLRPEARSEPNPPPPHGKIPVFTTAQDADTNRDSFIEKAILEAIHLQGEFRNTKEFRAQHDITYGQCIAVLKRLRERGVISLEGTARNTSYIFKDPALRLKNKSAAPIEPPPAALAAVVAEPAAVVAEPAVVVAEPVAVVTEPAAVVAEPAAVDPPPAAASVAVPPAAAAPRTPAVAPPSAPRGPTESERREKLTEFIRAIKEGYFSDARRLYEDDVGPKGRGRRLSSLVELQRLMNTAVLDLIKACFDTLNQNSDDIAVIAKQSRRIASLSSIIVAAHHNDTGMPREELRNCLMPHIARLPVKVKEKVLDRLKDDEIFDAKSIAEALQAAKPEQAAEPERDVRSPETGADIAEDFRQAIRVGRFYDAKTLYVANLAKKIELDSIVLGGVRIILDELRSCSDNQRADRIIGMVSESIRLFKSTDIAPGIEDSEFRTIILDASRNLSAASLRALRAELPSYCRPAHEPIQSPMPRTTAAASDSGAARQPVAWRADRADRPAGSGDPPFVREFLQEVGKGNIPAARVVYEHDPTRQGALNSAALRHITMRLDWLASNTSAHEDDIRGQCRVIRHAANAILKTKDSEYGMPLERLQGALSGQIAGLPDTMRQKVLTELKDIFSHQNISAGTSAAPPAPPASEAPRPAPARGPTADQMRDSVADFVYNLEFEHARRVNTDKENFRKGILMAVVRHLLLIAGSDEVSNNHLQSASDILKRTRQHIPPEMAKAAIDAAIRTMKEQPDRYPPNLIFKIRFFLRQYL